MIQARRGKHSFLRKFDGKDENPDIFKYWQNTILGMCIIIRVSKYINIFLESFSVRNFIKNMHLLCSMFEFKFANFFLLLFSIFWG